MQIQILLLAGGKVDQEVGKVAGVIKVEEYFERLAFERLGVASVEDIRGRAQRCGALSRRC